MISFYLTAREAENPGREKGKSCSEALLIQLRMIIKAAFLF